MKKFKNLWAMGLILFGVILLSLYLTKLISPEFVISVAQYEPIVKFGEYIDSHLWAYYLYNFIVSMFVYYFYCCACCRKKKLSIVELLILALVNILLFLSQKYISNYYIYLNTISLIFIPCIFCMLDKKKDFKYFYTTCVVFTIHTFAQIFSLEIRDLSMLITSNNSATFTILLIDVYIWLILLYNYFNFKEGMKNG